VTPPHAVALRLVARTQEGKPPRPPLGVTAWTPTADAIAVLLDTGDAGDGGDLRAIASVVAQLPPAADLPHGTPVFVLGRANARRSFWRVFARDLAIPRDVRCTALLVRGYIGIGAAEIQGDDLAWGQAP
jgi:hypothetical protein